MVLAFKIADVGVLTLIMTLLAVLFLRVFRVPLRRSFSFRSIEFLWSNWKSKFSQSQEALGKAAIGALFLGSVFFGSISFWASLRRHAAFESHAFDLGIFTNAIWNFTQNGQLYSSVKGGMWLFADHQSPIFLLCAPFFAVFSSAKTLLALQAYGLALGALPLALVARQFVGKRDTRLAWIVPSLPWVYWAYLPIRYATLFDFHPEVFILPLFLAAIAGFQGTSRYARISGFVFLFLALMGKESAGPLAVGVGIAWLLGAGPESTRTFTRRASVGWIFAGLLVFYLDLKVVPGWVGAPGYAYAGLYSQYGSGALEILLSPFLKTQLVLQQLFGPSRWVFLFWTLAPLGFLPILNWRAIPAFLPAYLMLFLSAGEHRVDVHWHYGIEPAVGLFFALPAVLVEFSQGSLRKWLPWFVAFAVLATYTKSDIYKGIRYEPNAHMQWLSAQFLSALDPSLPLAATESLVSHLSTRHWVERLDYLLEATSEQPLCAVYDESLSNWPMQISELEKVLRMLSSPPWLLDYQCGVVRVWSRDGARCLRVSPFCSQTAPF